MRAPTHATFFLSTGRCGTQWFSDVLAGVYPDSAVVTHEPLGGAYNPKKYLRSTDIEALAGEESVSQHLADIKDVLDNDRVYIETGWPCYPAAPLMIDRLGPRARFVHLVRNPVNVALSLATHDVYHRRDGMVQCALDPFDAGVVQKDLAREWDAMTQYEKTLFWWTEVNLYILELKKTFPDRDFFFLRYEDFFTPGDDRLCRKLVEFMGLEYVSDVERRKFDNVDKHRFLMPAIDWRLIFKYPETCAVAGELGYGNNDLYAAADAGAYEYYYGTFM